MKVWAGSSPPISLDDHVRLGICHEVGGCVGQQRLGDAGRCSPGHVAHSHAREHDRRTIGCPKFIGPLEQGADDLATDRPGAEHGNAHRSRSSAPSD